MRLVSCAAFLLTLAVGGAGVSAQTVTADAPGMPMSLIPANAPTITTSAGAREPELLIPAAPVVATPMASAPMVSTPMVSTVGAPEQTASVTQPMISVTFTADASQARR